MNINFSFIKNDMANLDYALILEKKLGYKLLLYAHGLRRFNPD